MNKADRHIFCFRINILWIAPLIHHIISTLSFIPPQGLKGPGIHSKVHLGDLIEQAAFKICLYQWKKEIISSHEQKKVFKWLFAISVGKSSLRTFGLTEMSRISFKKFGASSFLSIPVRPLGGLCTVKGRELLSSWEQCIIRKYVFSVKFTVLNDIIYSIKAYFSPIMLTFSLYPRGAFSPRVTACGSQAKNSHL